MQRTSRSSGRCLFDLKRRDARSCSLRPDVGLRSKTGALLQPVLDHPDRVGQRFVIYRQK